MVRAVAPIAAREQGAQAFAVGRVAQGDAQLIDQTIIPHPLALPIERQRHRAHAAGGFGERNFGRRRHLEQLRRVAEQPGGFAGARVFNNLAGNRVRRIGRDAGKPEGGRVGHRNRSAVPIDRMVWRGGVEFVLIAEHGRPSAFASGEAVIAARRPAGNRVPPRGG